MWPPDQHGGGQQHPQGVGPYGPPQQGQPPYGQPPPGQQPYGQQPYGQQPQGPWPGAQAPYPAKGQWAGPPGAPPPSRNNALLITLASVTAVVLVAAVVIGLTVLKDDDKPKAAPRGPSASPSSLVPGLGGDPSSEPSEGQTPAEDGSGGGSGGLTGPEDDPSKQVKPVVPGWQPVPRKERLVAYDVPKGWKVQEENLLIGFENEDGSPKVLMGGTALFREKWCGTDERAATGTKGANGAKSTADAALAAAESWARAAYTDQFGGTVRMGKVTSFSNKHGFKGSTVTAKVTGTSKARNKCASDGIVRTVAVKAPNGEYAVWILVADTGVPGAVPAKDIETMMGSLRFMKAS